MPETRVVFFRSSTGTVPVLDAVRGLLERGERRVVAKCRVRIDRLAQVGHELRRPEADYLENGIYELRIVHGRVHHRVLYFYSDGTAVLSHLIRKEGRVPRLEIERAEENRRQYDLDPEEHTHRL